VLETSRHVLDVLLARGYEVHYQQFVGGRDYLSWSETSADGLIEPRVTDATRRPSLHRPRRTSVCSPDTHSIVMSLHVPALHPRIGPNCRTADDIEKLSGNRRIFDLACARWPGQEVERNPAVRNPLGTDRY